MEFNALQTEALRQIDDALHHIRAKDRLRQRLQEIIGNNFAAVETGYQKKFQELRDLMGGTPSDLIGNTRAMQEVERQVRQIASSDAVVLIRGRQVPARNTPQGLCTACPKGRAGPSSS